MGQRDGTILSLKQHHNLSMIFFEIPVTQIAYGWRQIDLGCHLLLLLLRILLLILAILFVL